MPTAVPVLASDETTRDKLFAFRYRVYVAEQGYRPPGADHARRMLRDDFDPVSVSFALLAGGEVTGSLRFTHLDEVPDPEPLIRRHSMWPAIDRFGRGAISACTRFMFDTARPGYQIGMFRLMALGYEYECEAGRRLTYGNCGPGLLPFYEHMGFRVCGPPYRDPVYGEKVPIVLLFRDKEWLTRVRSPLARCARSHSDDWAARDWFRTAHGAVSRYSQGTMSIGPQFD